MTRLCVVLVGLSLAVAARSGGQQPVFRGGASTVSLYPTVRDQTGRLVDDLTQADFQVLDAGKPAHITTFSNDIVPITVAVMLDMSISMAGEQERVRDAALHFVELLLPVDRARIGTFGEEIALSPWLTADKTILQRVLREEVWPGDHGGTPLWSAVRAAMTSLSAETGRRVMLVLSDGVDTGCPRGASTAGERCARFNDIEKLAADGEFMIYSVGMEGPGLAGGLQQLADQTGGGRFELKRAADLTMTFGQVADELHHQYAIGFTSVVLDGAVHSLEVQVRKPGMTARARKSYLAVDR